MNDVIAVDIGNSTIACGLFRGGILLDTWRCETEAAREAAELISERPDGPVMLASVVPSAARELSKHLSELGRQVVELQSQSIIKGTYSTLGADRQANAVAAWKLYGKQSPVAVLDLGTATTLTAVSSTGEFRGGFISLGLGRHLISLHNQAAQLPSVTIENRRSQALELAMDTESAIANGTIIGHIGLVENWLRTARRALGPNMVTIATGGWASFMSRHTGTIDYVDANLTLKGIYLMAEAEAGLKDQG